MWIVIVIGRYQLVCLWAMRCLRACHLQTRKQASAILELLLMCIKEHQNSHVDSFRHRQQPTCVPSLWTGTSACECVRALPTALTVHTCGRHMNRTSRLKANLVYGTRHLLTTCRTSASHVSRHGLNNFQASLSNSRANAHVHQETSEFSCGLSSSSAATSLCACGQLDACEPVIFKIANKPQQF